MSKSFSFFILSYPEFFWNFRPTLFQVVFKNLKIFLKTNPEFFQKISVKFSTFPNIIFSQFFLKVKFRNFTQNFPKTFAKIHTNFAQNKKHSSKFCNNSNKIIKNFFPRYPKISYAGKSFQNWPRNSLKFLENIFKIFFFNFIS